LLPFGPPSHQHLDHDQLLLSVPEQTCIVV
jgi:hypothetical protein